MDANSACRDPHHIIRRTFDYIPSSLNTPGVVGSMGAYVYYQEKKRTRLEKSSRDPYHNVVALLRCCLVVVSVPAVTQGGGPYTCV